MGSHKFIAKVGYLRAHLLYYFYIFFSVFVHFQYSHHLRCFFADISFLNLRKFQKDIKQNSTSKIQNLIHHDSNSIMFCIYCPNTYSETMLNLLKKLFVLIFGIQLLICSADDSSSWEDDDDEDEYDDGRLKIKKYFNP